MMQHSVLTDASIVLRRNHLGILKDSWQAHHTRHNMNRWPLDGEFAHWAPRYFAAAKIVTYVVGVPYRQRSRSIELILRATWYVITTTVITLMPPQAIHPTYPSDLLPHPIPYIDFSNLSACSSPARRSQFSYS
jgi:hypothetical protein